MRSHRPRFRTAACALAVLVLVGACTPSAAAGQAPPSAAPSSAAGPGDFAGSVDIGGGRTMYLECRGQGSPTVILESGYHDSSDLWSIAEVTPPVADGAVLPGIGRFARVCAYDRPGTLRYAENPGSVTTRTSPVHMPRTAADVVTDLHTLLRVAGVPGPYVLVAHSLGGLFSRLYQRTYPDEVRAMVLVDTFSPQVPQLFGPLWPAYRDLLSATGTGTDPTAERIDLDASISQLDQAPAMRPVPVAVISKTEPFGGLPATLPGGLTGADIERLWPQVQAGVVAIQPQTPQTLATGSDHYIQVHQPDLIINDTRLVMARAGG
jgi:pimeloyl-ACP methyl ester carboxylesterase